MQTVGQIRRKMRMVERFKASATILFYLITYGLAFRGVAIGWSAFKGNPTWWGYLIYGMANVILVVGFIDEMLRGIVRFRRADIRRNK